MLQVKHDPDCIETKMPCEEPCGSLNTGTKRRSARCQKLNCKQVAPNLLTTSRMEDNCEALMKYAGSK